MGQIDWTYGVICLRCGERWQTNTSSTNKLDNFTQLTFVEWFSAGCNLSYESWLRNGFGSKRKTAIYDGKQYAEWLKTGFGSEWRYIADQSTEVELSFPNHEIERFIPFGIQQITCSSCGTKETLNIEDIKFDYHNGLKSSDSNLIEVCKRCAKRKSKRNWWHVI